MVPVASGPTVKFRNWLDPLKQPVLGGVIIVDNDAGAPHGTIDAHAGAANARGIATIKNRLNINVFFIY